MRRKLAMLLCLLLLIQLSLIPAYGAERVYFTAVGNNVLPLSDSTMPFWSSGYVYVASSVFTGAGRESLGISQVVNNEKNRVVLYSGGRSLTFDLARYTATDNDGQVYYPGAVRRNGTIFVPAYAVTRCFDLTYSVIEVRRGSLVWIRQSSYTLSDSYYADAAEYSMESVYADYLRAREQMEPPPERPAPPTGTGSGTSGTNGGTGSAAVPPAPQPKPAPEPEPEEEETLELHGQKIYLCIAAGGDTSGLLDALDAYQGQGAFFFSPEQMEASGNLPDERHRPEHRDSGGRRRTVPVRGAAIGGRQPGAVQSDLWKDPACDGNRWRPERAGGLPDSTGGDQRHEPGKPERLGKAPASNRVPAGRCDGMALGQRDGGGPAGISGGGAGGRRRVRGSAGTFVRRIYRKFNNLASEWV